MHLVYRESRQWKTDRKGRIGHSARALGRTVRRYGETKGMRVRILATCASFFTAHDGLQVLSSNNKPHHVSRFGAVIFRNSLLPINRKGLVT